MHRQPASARCSPASRSRGFTLIELLVVMAIIALLFTITFSGIGGALITSRAARTRTTIQKVDSELQRRLEALRIQLTRQSTQLKADTALQFARIGLGYLDRQNPILDIVTRKELLRRNFPESFAELCDLSGDPTNTATYGKPGRPGVDDNGDGTVDFLASGAIDVRELGWPGSDDAAFASVIRTTLKQNAINFAATGYTHSQTTESAALLHLMLTVQNGALGAGGRTEFASYEIRDTDGDGLLEFVDAWEQPLHFYRWPTRLMFPYTSGNTLPQFVQAQLDGNAPTFGDFKGDYGSILISNVPLIGGPRQRELFRDRDDPQDLLMILFERISDATIRANATKKFQIVYHTPQTFSQLMIVSSGPDKVLGLEEPYQKSGANPVAHLANPDPATSTDVNNSPIIDNLTNLRR